MASVELKEVDFSVIREDYSRFILNDETVIKAKIVVKKILSSPLKTPEGYPLQTTFDAIHVVSAKVIESLRREPSKEPLNPMVDRGEEVEVIKEEIRNQEYITDDGFRVTIKPFVSKIFRYKKYDIFGYPIYNVILQPITTIDKM